jgi:hypothetical protein
MSFAKFVWLFAHEKLYFARLDQHDDWWEGLIPESWDYEKQKYIRFNAYINCWHMNNRESDSMWKMYGNQNAETVAIKSTVGHLIESLGKSSRTIYIGKIDYSERNIKEENLYFPVTCKRKEFQHERELRLCLSSDNSFNPPDLSKLRQDFSSLGVEKTDMELLKDIFNDWNPKGILAKVDLKKLIREIILCPGSGKAFKEAVEYIAKNKIADVKIKHSKYDPSHQNIK